MDAAGNPNLGKKFPAVNAATLEGKKTTVPDDAAGKVTLVCVAFLRESTVATGLLAEPLL